MVIKKQFMPTAKRPARGTVVVGDQRFVEFTLHDNGVSSRKQVPAVEGQGILAHLGPRIPKIAPDRREFLRQLRDEPVEIPPR